MPKILLYEENKNLALLYALELQEEGHDVLLAVDFQDALRKISAERVDLVIMEIPRKGTDLGWGMARSLCLHITAPVIVNSLIDPNCEPMRPLPVSAWVVKSSDVDPLLQTVRKTLSHSHVAPADLDSVAIFHGRLLF